MRLAARLTALSLSDLKRNRTYLRLMVDVNNCMRIERFRFDAHGEDGRLSVTVNPNGLEERSKQVIPICAGLVAEERANLHRVFAETEGVRIILELLVATNDLNGYINAVAESLTSGEWNAYCRPHKAVVSPIKGHKHKKIASGWRNTRP